MRLAADVDSDVRSQAGGVAVLVCGTWYLADGLGERSQAALLADRLNGEFYLVVRFGVVASCVGGVDADQVVESVARFEGHVFIYYFVSFLFPLIRERRFTVT